MGVQLGFQGGTPLDRHHLSAVFNQIGLLLELSGANPYKTRAYYQAARTIENLHQNLDVIWRENRIGELPGFGQALVQAVEEYLSTGKIGILDELQERTPQGLLQLLRIPGLGPKKVRALYEQLGIDSLEALEQACNEHRIGELPGFGAKTELKILAALEAVRRYQGRYLPIRVAEDVQSILTLLREIPTVIRAEVAGSFRRRKEIIKDLDFVVASTEPLMVFDPSNAPWVSEVLSSGETKSTFRLSSGITADFRWVAPETFASAWLHFTGSAEHNTELRQLAKTMNLKLNEYGLMDDEKVQTFDSEAAIYNALGLDYIPPELREGMGEIEAARNQNLPRLATLSDLKGIFHCHTDASDGHASLQELAEEARRLGYSYLGIADHSQSAKYARGLTAEQLLRQGREIDALNGKWTDFRLLKGVECDILPDGTLDYPDEILATLDYVVASVHTHFGMERDAMTQRLIRAIQNPWVTILGHPTGRILLGREGYPIDMERLLIAAKESGTAMEFNANPHRYDLDWRWCRRAVSLGVKIAINPDAHRVDELQMTAYGLEVLRKGWVQAKDLLNTESVDALLEDVQHTC